MLQIDFTKYTESYFIIKHPITHEVLNLFLDKRSDWHMSMYGAHAKSFFLTDMRCIVISKDGTSYLYTCPTSTYPVVWMEEVRVIMLMVSLPSDADCTI